MTELDQRLLAIRYLQKTKTIYENKLIVCLKIPVYKYFYNIYKDCFDEEKKIKKDSQAVVVFQELLTKMRVYSPEDINEQAVKILSHAANCSLYIAKLIDAVLTSNNRCQLLSIDADEKYYSKQIPNSLLFFKTLITQLSEMFILDPFMFCEDKPNNKVLKCINETIQLIQTCIENTISVLSFDDEHLDEYINFVNNMHVDLKRMITEKTNEPKSVFVTNLNELKTIETLEKEAKKELKDKVTEFIEKETQNNPLLDDFKENADEHIKNELGLVEVEHDKESVIEENSIKDKDDISDPEFINVDEEAKTDNESNASKVTLTDSEDSSLSEIEFGINEEEEQFIPEQLAFIPYKSKKTRSTKNTKKSKKSKIDDFDLNNM